MSYAITENSPYEKFAAATSSDPTFQLAAPLIVDGWPKNKKDCSVPVKSFWAVKPALEFINCLFIRGRQIVIRFPKRNVAKSSRRSLQRVQINRKSQVDPVLARIRRDSAEFRNSPKKLLFKHSTLSPNYPESYGLAERTVQTFKAILIKSMVDGQTVQEAVRALRSTPVGDGLPSPSILLQSRNLRGS